LILAVVGTMTSLAIFNVTGVTITQKINSLTRSVLDVTGTVFIWLISLMIGWEKFSFLQVIYFLFFNDS